MSVNLNPITPIAKSADQKDIQPKPAESGWSGRKIALAVLGTIAAIASVVGTVFLVMMLTKKKEGETAEDGQAPLQLVAKKEDEASKSTAAEFKKSKPTKDKSAPLVHLQKNRPKINHRPPTVGLLKKHGNEQPATKTNELMLSQFFELPKQPSVDTSKDQEIALKLQQELNEAVTAPAEYTSQDEAIAIALAKMESVSKPALKLNGAVTTPVEDTSQDKAIAIALAKMESVNRPAAKQPVPAKKHPVPGTTAFALPHGVTKTNYVPWAFAEAKKNYVKAH